MRALRPTAATLAALLLLTVRSRAERAACA
jgi:hypothetical protein